MMARNSADPKLETISFRLTPAERRELDAMRGTRSITDFLRGLIFGGGR